MTTVQGARAALGVVDLALEQIGRTRSDLGAKENQFGSAMENMGNARVNLEGARSQIMDIDLAEEAIIMKQMENLEKASAFALAKSGSSKDHLLDLLA